MYAELRYDFGCFCRVHCISFFLHSVYWNILRWHLSSSKSLVCLFVHSFAGLHHIALHCIALHRDWELFRKFFILKCLLYFSIHHFHSWNMHSFHFLCLYLCLLRFYLSQLMFYDSFDINSYSMEVQSHLQIKKYVVVFAVVGMLWMHAH